MIPYIPAALGYVSGALRDTQTETRERPDAARGTLSNVLHGGSAGFMEGDGD